MPDRVPRLLTFTTLYPDGTRPRHGIFVESRLRRMVESGAVQSVVMAPVPWFPWRHRAFGSYAAYAGVAREELRHGIRVIHPRYPAIPRVGMSVAPFLMAAFVIGHIRRLAAQGYDFDVIDAHYFYPDGVAAAILGSRLRKPVVISARGSDINLIPRYHVPRGLIRYAVRRARHVVAVSGALRERLLDLGVDQGRISVLRNGVDTQLFRPLARATLRERLRWRGRVLLSVGNLVRLKGHDVAVASLAYLPDASLVVVGEGPERQALEAQARRIGVTERVRFVPSVDQETLCEYYNAADILVLASCTEGWPNVLLEAMACGTPVVASRVGGTPEIVCAPEAGRLFAPRAPRALADAVDALTAAAPARDATRAYAQGFGWDEVAEAQAAIYRRAAACGLGTSVA